MHRLGASLLVAVAVVALAGGTEPVKKDVKALQGSWAVDSLEYNGKDVTARYKFTFAFKDNVATIEGDDAVRKEYAKLRFKLYPDLNPPGVDITVAGGVQLDVVMEGIYEVKGDQLKLCVKVFGKDRPSEFKSGDGSSTAMLTLKRQK